ncbi:MAG: pilus assembly protein [Chloroflexi bacterium]|nr:pilus assembly protein [Chloroflexota bacterium]
MTNLLLQSVELCDIGDSNGVVIELFCSCIPGVSMDELRSSRGQSLVELALTLPILLLILLGGLDVGRAYFYQVTIANAAREGVRAASNYNLADADIRGAARNEVGATIALPDSNIAINPSPIRSSGQPVTVTVSYDFRALTPVLDRILGNGPVRLAASAAAVVQ